MTTLRLILSTILLCGFAYTAVIRGFARIANPGGAEGSLVRTADGRIIGSRLVAQEFKSDRYFFSRPSACGYQAGAAGGSNLSPANPKLADRAAASVIMLGADAGNHLPADLVTASGSGLDPDISEAAARFQAVRVAKARELPLPEVMRTIDALKRPLPVDPDGSALINVLELNLALDAIP